MGIGYKIEKNMSKSVRFILFLVFLLAFCISAPAVVLYTAGYRLDLTHGRIVHTAVLSISSEPRNATIRIDELPYADRTPAVLETILPGEHTVALQKDGYLPWKTRLAFESRSARVVGPIILFLDSQPALQKTLNAVISSVHEPSNTIAYATVGSSWLEVWSIHATSGQTSLLLRLPYVATDTYDLLWSQDGTYLALTQKRGSRMDVSVSRVSDGTVMELAQLGEDVEDVWWDLSVNPILNLRTGTSITQLPMTTLDAQILPFNAQNVTTFQNTLVSLSQSNNRAVLSYQDGDTASIITYLPLGDYVFVPSPTGLLALSETRRGRLILIDPSNREQPILFNEEATQWSWSPSEDILLYSSGYDLKRYVRSAHETQTLTRLSTSIDGMAWFPLGTSVLYQTGGQIIALNLDGSTVLSQTTLATNLHGDFWLDQGGSVLSALVATHDGWEWWIRSLQN